MARIRLFLLAVMCWLCLVPAAHAIRPQTPAELQLKEETPCQQPLAYWSDAVWDVEMRNGLLVLNNPLRYTDPDGKAPSDWANAMQPAIDDYYGGYISNPIHTSTIGLFGAYMGQSVASGYNDMLRFGNWNGKRRRGRDIAPRSWTRKRHCSYCGWPPFKNRRSRAERRAPRNNPPETHAGCNAGTCFAGWRPLRP